MENAPIPPERDYRFQLALGRLGEWHRVSEANKESRVFLNTALRMSYASVNKHHPHLDWLEEDALIHAARFMKNNARSLLLRLPTSVRTLGLCVEVRKLCGEAAIKSIPRHLRGAVSNAVEGYVPPPGPYQYPPEFVPDIPLEPFEQYFADVARNPHMFFPDANPQPHDQMDDHLRRFPPPELEVAVQQPRPSRYIDDGAEAVVAAAPPPSVEENSSRAADAVIVSMEKCMQDEDTKKRENGAEPQMGGKLKSWTAAAGIECFVCMNEIEVGEKFVDCECTVGHIFCINCFELTIRIQTDTKNGDTFNPTSWAANRGRVTCRSTGDFRIAFTDDVIIAACPGVMTSYINSRCEYAAVEAADSSKAAATAAMISMSKETLRNYLSGDEALSIKRAVKHVQDHIFTMRCPACKAPFADYVGCSSVLCDCGMSFCGLCLEFSDKVSHDVHRHVLTCRVNPDPGNSYAFINPGVRRAIAANRGEAAKVYIASLTLSPPSKYAVASALSKDAADIGVVVDGDD